MQKNLKTLKQEEKRQTSLHILESLLFASSEPLSLLQLQTVLATFHKWNQVEIKSLLHELKEHYKEGHAFQLDEIAGGYLLRTKAIFGPFVEQIKGQRKATRFSSAAIEVLAIIAHKKKITRSQIDAIRGVDSTQILQTLVEKEMIRLVGHDKGPRKAALFSVTDRFLEHFGMKTMEDLSAIKLPSLSSPQTLSSSQPA